MRTRNGAVPLAGVILGAALIGASMLAHGSRPGPVPVDKASSDSRVEADVQIDPLDPMPGGVELSQARSADLPFVPDVPPGLGTPISIQMAPPSLVPLAHRQIALGYEKGIGSTGIGSFILSEELTNASAMSELIEFAKEPPGCSAPSPDPEGETVTCHSGEREVITLPGGGAAVVLSSA